MRFLLILALVLLFAVLPAGAAGWQTIAGTPIALVPPAGFRLSQDFTGLTNDRTGAGVLVAIFPADSANTAENIYNNPEKFAQAMRRHNFIITGHNDEKTRTGEAVTIYSGTQSDGKTVYDKWATLISHNGGLYMVTLQSPAQAGLERQAALDMFRSIRLGAWNSLAAQVSALPFTFKTVAPFVTRSTLMGSAVTLQTDEEKTSGPVSVYIIRDPQTQSAYDTGLAQNLYLVSIRPAFQLQQVTEEKTVSFAGKEGKLLAGTGIDADGKNQAIMLYTALDDSRKAIYLQALGTENTLLQLKDTIGKIAASILLKSKN